MTILWALIFANVGISIFNLGGTALGFRYPGGWTIGTIYGLMFFVALIALAGANP